TPPQPEGCMWRGFHVAAASQRRFCSSRPMRKKTTAGISHTGSSAIEKMKNISARAIITLSPPSVSDVFVSGGSASEQEHEQTEQPPGRDGDRERDDNAED